MLLLLNVFLNVSMLGLNLRTFTKLGKHHIIQLHPQKS